MSDEAEPRGKELPGLRLLTAALAAARQNTPRRLLLICGSAAAGFALWLSGGPVAAGWALAWAGALAALLPALHEPPHAVARIAHPNEGLAAAMLHALPLPAVLLDAGGSVAAFNRRAADLHGTLRIGQPLAVALRQPGVADAALRAMLPGQPAQTVEYTERVPVERHLEATIARLNDVPVAGAPALLMVMRDLSHDEQLARLRADFVANASHELRTPLASLLGFIETLEGPARDDADARDRFLPVMAAQGRRMARLIDNLLALSRIEMREHIRPLGEVDLGGVVRAVVAGLEPAAAARGIAVKLKEEDLPPIIGDEDELTQVAQNLLHNAIKFSHASGEVRLSLAPGPAGEAMFIVADDGIGIAPEHLPRLTERFYRAGGNDRVGTGLGLAIVKHVVNRHRGRLTIASPGGRGAVFSVALPENKF